MNRKSSSKSDKQNSLEASQGEVETLKAQVASDNAVLEAQEDELLKGSGSLEG